MDDPRLVLYLIVPIVLNCAIFFRWTIECLIFNILFLDFAAKTFNFVHYSIFWNTLLKYLQLFVVELQQN